MSIRVAVFAVIVLALGACDGGEPSPTTLPTPAPPAGSTSTAASPAPSPTATPTAVAPTLPAAARQDSPAGAEAFARFYLAAQDYANRTGDTRLLRSMGRCKGCDSVVAGIERHYRAGGRVEGGQITIIDSTVPRHVASQAALVSVSYNQAAGRLIKKTGQEEVVPAQSANQVLITLTWKPSGWSLINIQGIS